jgi:hypothetical protein
MKRTALVLGVASIAFFSPAMAQSPAPDSQPKPQFSPVMPVKISPRATGADKVSQAAAEIDTAASVDPDTIGNLATANDGALGRDVWKGYTEFSLRADLDNIDARFRSPAYRKLLVRALLTTPDALPDTSTEAFSPRLDLLVRLGAFEEAFALYKKLNGDLPSADAAVAGVTAMDGLYRLGLACLEEKAVPADLKDRSPEFWALQSRLCAAILAGAPPANPMPPDVATLVASPLPAVILALRGNDLSRAGLAYETVYFLPPQLVALFLKTEPLAPQVRTFAETAAAEYGMRDWPAAAPLPKDQLKTLIAGGDVDGRFAVQAPAYAGLPDAETFTADEASNVTALLIRRGFAVPAHWARLAYPNLKAANPKSVTDIELVAAALARPPKVSLSEKTPVPTLTALDFLLNKAQAGPDEYTKHYEKVLRLTPQNDYVMPDKVLTDGLLQASQEKNAGQAILRTGAILSGRRVSDIHPAVLIRICQALRAAGFDEEVRSLAHEALADVIEYKS